MRDGDTQILGPQHSFQTTSWHLVRAFRDPRALNSLIGVYWKPLYFFVRQRGYGNEEAKDLVQEFLARLLERQDLAKADPSRGRFRTYLLAALSNFLKDRAKAAARQKRGALVNVFSLDFERGEREYQVQSAAAESPEALLDRAWAKGLLEQAVRDLEADPVHLQAFRLWLADEDYKTITAQTGMSESAAKSAVHRLRGQLREAVTSHLRRTAADEAELKQDLADFLRFLS